MGRRLIRSTSVFLAPGGAAVWMVVLALFSATAWSQPYPSRPIRMIVASSPSSAADIVARILAQSLSKDLGQQVIIDNRPGAGANLGAEIAAKAPFDGYTLLWTTPAHAINSGLPRKASYDLARDFAPISQVSSGLYLIVVHPSVPARSVTDLMAFAKSKPGQLYYASGGVGNATHLAVELFKVMAGIDVVHVPYQGAGPAMTALLGGEAQLAIANLTAALPHVTSGRMLALAITSKRRSALMPEVPTVAESGLPGYEVTAWFGVVAPKNVSRSTISRLNSEIVKNVLSPNLKEILVKQGAEPVGSAPEAFAAFVQTEIAKWAKVIRNAKVSME